VATAPSSPSTNSALREVAAVFLKLGVIGFGGPAAHIAMMRDEVVRRRRWIDDARFLDLLGMTNLIPGPNSTEMAIHLGYVRAGWWGLAVGGVCFILPAMTLVLVLAWAYVAHGTRPEASAVLYGIKPVIIAVVIQAAWALTRTAVKSVLLATLGVLTVALYVLGAHELLLLLGGGVVVALVRRVRGAALSPLVLLTASATGSTAGGVGAAGAAVSLTTLCLTFLKIGAVLYGSGYVLLAFLRNDFVERLAWLTDRQLLDAVAIGQFTPGPVFTTATFIGYVVAGWTGGVLATVAIFLPSFVFVALSHPLVPKIRASTTAAAFLDGVNVAALGLMVAVTWQLGRAAIVDIPTALLATGAAVALVVFRVNSAWLVAGGAILGVVIAALGRG
jgi:chromate transporter